MKMNDGWRDSRLEIREIAKASVSSRTGKYLRLIPARQIDGEKTPLKEGYLACTGGFSPAYGGVFI